MLYRSSTVGVLDRYYRCLLCRVVGLGVMSRLSVGGFNDPHSESSYVDDFVRTRLGSDDIDVVRYTLQTQGMLLIRCVIRRSQR